MGIYYGKDGLFSRANQRIGIKHPRLSGPNGCPKSGPDRYVSKNCEQIEHMDMNGCLTGNPLRFSPKDMFVIIFRTGLDPFTGHG